MSERVKMVGDGKSSQDVDGEMVKKKMKMEVEDGGWRR